ncbi:MAG TPA: methyltransferase domain-containing protein [Bacteroidales bacterium]|nr:methyltransferase domain-containing protein [Bacteroidales bacterium]
MTNSSDLHLHPVEKAGMLESRLRRLLQNPEQILKKYIKPGMKVLDLGCGTGYFTLEIARRVGAAGSVVAADVQARMLEILRQKIKGNPVSQNIRIHHSKESSLGITEKFDFILAFYAFHEMRFIDDMIHELKSNCYDQTRILIAEQKIHVPKAAFKEIISKMEDNGFVACERPNIFLSRAVVMRKEGRSAVSGSL